MAHPPQDVIVSVLESSATRRDAKGYLQKYASKKQPAEPRTVAESPQFVQGTASSPEPSWGDDEARAAPDDEPTKVAIVRLRAPQRLDQPTVDGIAKTLCQLRALGLLAIVVLDCGIDESRQTFVHEALRLCEAIDSSFAQPGAKFADTIFVRPPPPRPDRRAASSIFSDGVRVDDIGFLARALHRDMVVVVPSLVRPDDLSSPRPAHARETVLALIKYLSGMQFAAGRELETRPVRLASVERVILLDPLGGTPTLGSPGVCHRFINLEQEFDSLIEQLVAPRPSSSAAAKPADVSASIHAANLGLAKDCLSLLPSSSSALITSPLAAANRKPAASAPPRLDEMVTTRNRRNPLLHNLLTDRPVFSPSLPLQRLRDGTQSRLQTPDASAATLVKRGMPVTIYPDPRAGPWRPPEPGSARLRLTDTCIHLPRLVHLIEDSFDRKLDVRHYLDRVNENLAGIIIAGEYEGGAILTWERPPGLCEHEAYDQGRLVPYLDKFAVLKSRQGSAGVADIVFNAMVQDCFPEGVCWRSRQNNPVNKWYSERSAGVLRLPDSNWTMFWTTLGLSVEHPLFRDYKMVCRDIQPSWADNKLVPPD